jgi:hypothetical protein
MHLDEAFISGAISLRSDYGSNDFHGGNLVDSKWSKKALGKPNVIVRKADTGRSVFADMKAPGMGKVRVMDRDVYEKASRSAGTAIKTIVGKPWKIKG